MTSFGITPIGELIWLKSSLIGQRRGEGCRWIMTSLSLYQAMEQKPLPLAAGEEVDYMLALKQEFRGAMRSLPFFIQPAAPHRGHCSSAHLAESLK